MRLKVHNGTPPNGENSLCSTCRNSTIIRGRTLNEEIVQCHAATLRPIHVMFKVTSCSAYSDERLPSYVQMMEDAWILQPGSRKQPAGFVRGSDLREEEMRSIMADLHGRTNE